MKSLCQNLHLYLASAWYSYRALYAWQRFGPYVSGKIIYPTAQMLFFLYLGRLAGVENPIYIVIGNILLLPATNGVEGVSMTISGERDFRTLPYLIASPASRGPLFLGRPLVHIIDGTLSTITAFFIGVLVFGLDLKQSNLLLVALSVLVISITSSGLGLILGSLSLRTREASTISAIAYFVLLVFCGVNLPVESLPRSMQWISYCLPLTRGIAAARQAMNGMEWHIVVYQLVEELLVGCIYFSVGYFLFRWFEKLSLVDGQIEAI